MPLVKFENVNDDITYGIWEICEDIETLLEQEEFINHEAINIPNLHPKKQLEYVTSRILIATLASKVEVKYLGIIKDEFGKPFLKGCNYHLSVSHSFPYAIAIIHKKKPVGIDIEYPSEKLKRIGPKFLNETEQQYEKNLVDLCKVWCIKETLYKIYGRKQVDYRKNLKVTLGDMEKTSVGTFEKEEFNQSYDIKVSEYEGFIYCFNF